MSSFRVFLSVLITLIGAATFGCLAVNFQIEVFEPSDAGCELQMELGKSVLLACGFGLLALAFLFVAKKFDRPNS